MMKVNDFQKYEVTLMISYEDYFRLIYESKYLLEARLGTDRMFIARKAIYGNNRRKAVQKAVQWFWKDFKGVLGPAHKVMTINDPFEEVAYDEGFACNDLANKYLDGDTIERLLAQADGDLFSWYKAHSKNMDVEIKDPNVWVSQIQGPLSMKLLENIADGFSENDWKYFTMISFMQNTVCRSLIPTCHCYSLFHPSFIPITF